MTQSELILDHLRHSPNTWFKSYELEKANLRKGWIGTRGARTCRDLASKDLILHRRIGKYVEYKATEPKEVVTRHVPALNLTLTERLF